MRHCWQCWSTALQQGLIPIKVKKKKIAFSREDENKNKPVVVRELWMISTLGSELYRRPHKSSSFRFSSLSPALHSCQCGFGLNDLRVHCHVSCLQHAQQASGDEHNRKTPCRNISSPLNENGSWGNLSFFSGQQRKQGCTTAITKSLKIHEPKLSKVWCNWWPQSAGVKERS